MNDPKKALAKLLEFVQRSTHWEEGGATRHDALLALGTLGADVAAPYRPQDCDEDRCQTCGEDGGTSCGDPNCGLLTGGDETAQNDADHIEWLEKGLAEWRATAQANARYAEAARATARVAINHLQELMKQTAPAGQSRVERAARDWLTSIGSEPG